MDYGKKLFFENYVFVSVKYINNTIMTQEAKAFTITDDGEYAVVLKTGEGEIDGT